MGNFWKIRAEGKDSTAEIELSGEVCQERPWWADEGDNNFIALNQFKNELKNIKGAKEVVIKLNSFGGDLFAGKAIYDELKELKAHKTVKIMGVAMSAATVIMLAGDKVVANTGDIIMIHEAKCWTLDYFDAENAQRMADSLNACNKALAELYSKKTGKSVQVILNALHSEKWFTASEAKEWGLIDEVIDEGTQVAIAASADGKMLFYGDEGKYFGGVNIPDRFKKILPVMNYDITAEAEKAVLSALDSGENKMETSRKGVEAMEGIKTVAELKEAFPDLVKAIQNEAYTEAKAEERKRLKEIEEIEASLSLDKEAIIAAKYGDSPMEARDLAFMNAQMSAKIGDNELEKMKKDAENSNANKVTADGKDGMKDTGLTAAQIACGKVFANLKKEFEEKGRF